MSKKAAAKKSKAAKASAKKEVILSLKDVTMDTFKDHVKSTFTTSCFGGVDDEGVTHAPCEVELTLVSCEKARGDRGGDTVNHPEFSKRTPFVVRFQGPDHFPFPDQMYTLTHPKIGTIPDVSMSLERCDAGVKTWMSAHFL